MYCCRSDHQQSGNSQSPKQHSMSSSHGLNRHVVVGADVCFVGFVGFGFGLGFGVRVVVVLGLLVFELFSINFFITIVISTAIRSVDRLLDKDREGKEYSPPKSNVDHERPPPLSSKSPTSLRNSARCLPRTPMAPPSVSLRS